MTEAAARPQRRPTSLWSLALLLLLVWGGHQGWQWWRSTHAVQEIQRLARPGDIVMYTTTECPYCASARTWLTRHQVPWRECNVETDQICLMEFQAQGAPGVPLMRVKGQWRLGFDPAWLSQALQR